jgi:hypothetical protein
MTTDGKSFAGLAKATLAILGLGIVANVAVAWALSAMNPWETRGVADGRASHNGSGFVKIFWFTRAGAEDVMVVHQEVWPEIDLLESESTPPPWYPAERALAQPIELDAEEHRVASIARARGWPLLALWDEGMLAEDATPRFNRPIPLRPIWRGLLLNSLVYSGVFAILLICARVMRRAIAKRRKSAH